MLFPPSDYVLVGDSAAVHPRWNLGGRAGGFPARGYWHTEADSVLPAHPAHFLRRFSNTLRQVSPLFRLTLFWVRFSSPATVRNPSPYRILWVKVSSPQARLVVKKASPSLEGFMPQKEELVRLSAITFYTSDQSLVFEVAKVRLYCSI
jgi:hypothetical protein